MIEEQREDERTVEVEEAAVVPDLRGTAAVVSVSQPEEHELEATYFDTESLDLARDGATLRRRTGGDDAGWRLRHRIGDEPSEVRRPPGRSARTAPKALLDPVRVVVRDRAVAPVAWVRTRRSTRRLSDADGVVLAELHDDHVEAGRIGVEDRALVWRAWVVELVDGGPELLETVGAVLQTHGTARARDASTLLRILGDAVAPGPQAAADGHERGSAARVVVEHLRRRTEVLHRQDSRVRAQQPGSVHELRIATRRLRSALQSYRPLLAVDDSVLEDLRWLQRSTGPARDAQVLRERFDRLLAEEPVELVMGPVRRRLDRELSAAVRSGREEVLRTLQDERYYRLLDRLDVLLVRPPLRDQAARPATEVLPRLLARDVRRLRREVRAVRQARNQVEREAALHRVRRKAKRLRYAAESMRDVLGKRVRRYASGAKRVQRALGRHQDAVVSRQHLRDYAVRSFLDGENTFTLGRLHGREDANAAQAVREYEKAWRRVPSAKRLTR